MARKEHINGVVYMTINKVNGKKYIGMDSRNRSSYYGSGVVLQKALQKYGVENFVKIPLLYVSDRKELAILEYHIIHLLDAECRDDYYNAINGNFKVRGGNSYKEIYCYDRDGCLIRAFASTRHAANYFGSTNTVAITQSIRKGSSAYGYYFNNIRYNQLPEKYMMKMLKRKIHQYALDGCYVRSYDSIQEASQQNNIRRSGINEAALGTRKRAGCFYWSFNQYTQLPAETIQSLHRERGIHKRRGVVQATKNGELVDAYDSCSDAARAVQGSPNGVISVARGRQNLHRCFRWIYIN